MREVRALELLGIRYVYDDSVRVAYVVSETINVPIGMLLMRVMSWLNGIGSVMVRSKAGVGGC